jgi:hypothetical protein
MWPLKTSRHTTGMVIVTIVESHVYSTDVFTSENVVIPPKVLRIVTTIRSRVFEAISRRIIENLVKGGVCIPLP